MATPLPYDPFDDVWDRLLLHLQDAGRTLPRPVTDVRLGEPGSVAAPILCCWYDGDHEGDLVPNTLTRASYTERVVIRGYWPVATRDPALSDKTERTARRCNRAITSRLWADEQLGGACAGLHFVERTTTGWIEMGGWVRTLTITLGIEMVDTDDIAVEG